VSDSCIVLRGGILVTMDPLRRVFAGDLLVQDGKIAAVGVVDAPEGASTVDVSGQFVLPGLIQGHVHLGQALLRGLAEGRELMDWLRDRVWPLEAAHDEDSAYWSGMLGAADCLLSGTTTIQEIGLSTQMTAIFNAIEDSGLRAIAGKCLMDTGHRVPPGLMQPPADVLAEAEALIETWHGAADGRIQGSLCPRFILSCTAELWRGTAELAAKHGVPVHTHLLEHPREEDEVTQVLGVGQLEYLDDLGILDTDLRIAHGVQFNEEHAKRLAGRSMAITHCPSANLKLGSGIADLGFLQSTPGITVGIGTDGAPCNNDMDALEEMRLAALLQGIRQGPGKFSAEQALALATIDGARAMGLADQIGSLEVGKAADILVLDLDRPATFGPEGVAVYDRIVYAAARDSVEHVLVGGRPLVREGQLVGWDLDALRRKPAEAIASLLRRAELP
jgi:cytosine/adenosine deaminase-related metal-dependent hydrolase